MTDTPPVISNRYVFAAMAICVTMMAALLWMPAVLGALALGYQLGPQELSYLAFAELFGFLLGTLFTSSKTLEELNRWVLIGCGALMAINLALLFAPASTFIFFRAAAGLATGMGFGYGLKLCSASSKPTRSFGLFTAAMSLVMIIGFQLVAQMIEMWGMVDGVADAHRMKGVVKIVFVIYAALAGGSAVILLTNKPPPLPGPSGPQVVGKVGARVVIGLLAIILSFIGQGSVWAFLQTLGIAHGFSVVGVANAMSTWAIMGIVGSLSAAALPGAISRTTYIGIALVVLWGGLYALYSPPSLLWYIAGCAIGGFYWNFVLSLLLGLLASIDPTGRGSVLGGAVSSSGSAIGPLFAGMLIQGTNYDQVGWFAGGLCAAGFTCVWIIEKHWKEKTS